MDSRWTLGVLSVSPLPGATTDPAFFSDTHLRAWFSRVLPGTSVVLWRQTPLAGSLFGVRPVCGISDLGIPDLFDDSQLLGGRRSTLRRDCDRAISSSPRFARFRLSE